MLPRKGDRVRVPGGRLGTVTEDEIALDGTVRVLVDGYGAARWYNCCEVKVIESHAITSAREGLAKLEEMTGAHVIQHVPSDIAQDACRLAYRRGLRRAQELAKEHVQSYSGHGGELTFDEFDAAIEQELSK